MRQLRKGRGSFAERELRSGLRRFLRRNWVVVGVFATILLLGAVGASIGLHGYLLGLVQGGLVVGGVWAVYHLYLVITGQYFRVAGTWGEDNTRDVLRAARRRHDIYDWIDNLEVEGGDVDHLVIAPGGVFALDSKWHAVEVKPEILDRDTRAASAGARRARSILRSEGHQEQVTPLVVIWGGHQQDVPGPGVQVNDVLVIRGQCLRAWLASRDHDAEVIDRRSAKAMTADLLQFRDRVRPERPSRRWQGVPHG